MTDLSGRIFGRLTVIKRVDDHIYPSGRHDIQYECKCDCGNSVNVLAIHLRSGHTQSCGCFRKDTTRETRTTHSMTGTRLHNIWRNMRRRCSVPNHPDYPNYGGRGIKICEYWDSNFTAFANWAMQSGYTPQLSIDRIDVNGDYCPENCRWATQKEQCNNTRFNTHIQYCGETHTMKEWAEKIGIKYGTLQSRIARGWSIEKALST